MFEDRRVFARIEAKFPVRFLNPVDGRQGQAETIDVSANGLGLLTKENLPSSTPLELWVSIPDNHLPLYTRGEVVWSQALENSGQRRVGVRLEKAELMGLARVLWMQNQA